MDILNTPYLWTYGDEKQVNRLKINCTKKLTARLAEWSSVWLLHWVSYRLTGSCFGSGCLCTWFYMFVNAPTIQELLQSWRKKKKMLRGVKVHPDGTKFEQACFLWERETNRETCASHTAYNYGKKVVTTFSLIFFRLAPFRNERFRISFQ